MPEIAVPDDQRAHRRFDRNRRISAFARPRLAGITVASRHHRQRAVGQGVVREQERAIAGVRILAHRDRVRDRRVCVQSQRRAVAGLVLPLHERRAARHPAIEPQHVGLQRQQTGIANSFLKNRVFEQQVVKDVLMVELRLRILQRPVFAGRNVVRDARPPFGDLQQLVPDPLDPLHRRSLARFQYRKAERV